MDEKDRLHALAAHATILGNASFCAGRWIDARKEGDRLTMGYPELSHEAKSFVAMAYAANWVRAFEWMEWKDTSEGRRLLSDPGALREASAEDLSHVITTIVRQDRFAEGVLLEAFENGVMLAAAERAGDLLGRKEGG